MKKRVFIFFCALFLSACADKENYQQAVLEQMQAEQDVKDYKIDPENIAKCIVNTSAKEMPGLFEFDPARLTAYRNYTKMLTLKQAKDPKKVMMELGTEFGSPKALADAHSNYTESVMECISAMLIDAEKVVPEAAKAVPEAKEATPPEATGQEPTVQQAAPKKPAQAAEKTTP